MAESALNGRAYVIKWNGEIIGAGPFPYEAWKQAESHEPVAAFIREHGPKEPSAVPIPWEQARREVLERDKSAHSFERSLNAGWRIFDSIIHQSIIGEGPDEPSAWLSAHARMLGEKKTSEAMPPVPCPVCSAPIFVRGDGTIVSHYNGNGDRCESNEKTYSAYYSAQPKEPAGEPNEDVPWLQFDCPACGAKIGQECITGASCMKRVLLAACPKCKRLRGVCCAAPPAKELPPLAQRFIERMQQNSVQSLFESENRLHAQEEENQRLREQLAKDNDRLIDMAKRMAEREAEIAHLKGSNVRD